MKEKKDLIKKFIKKYYKLIIILLCLIGIIEIVIDVFQKDIMKKDVIGYQLISRYLISDYATVVAKFITNFGGTICIFIISLIFFIFVKKKIIGIIVFLNLAISGGLNQFLKYIIQRPRPTEYRLINESGYSFPSGHSMVSMAFYGLFIYLVYKYVKNKYMKYGLITLLTLLIISIGISRIYLGVHYTSDVLAGFLISISYLIIFTSIINKYLDKSK